MTQLDKQEWDKKLGPVVGLRKHGSSYLSTWFGDTIHIVVRGIELGDRFDKIREQMRDDKATWHPIVEATPEDQYVICFLLEAP